MINQHFATQFSRELDKLKVEIQSFNNESNLWKALPGITNTAGNLSLHLSGNIQHFIGAIQGKSGYIRDRESEFGSKGLERNYLLAEIEKAKQVIETVFSTTKEGLSTETFPIVFMGGELTHGAMWLHLVSHFSYHLGQINYLRRILEEEINN